MNNSTGISVKGAKEHNLKNIETFIPRNKITVITGLSGSGKSSLAFDTIYAEGQRRYVESLSAYARQFLEQLKKPDVEVITGLSPAIAIDQKTSSLNPRSTVGTVTEIYDYMRLLFSKIGKPFCPKHKKPLEQQSIEHILKQVSKLKEGKKFILLSPVIRNKKGEFQKEFKDWLKKGFTRARIDGTYYELEAPPKLRKTLVHNIELVVDRIILKKSLLNRIKQSLEVATALSSGYLIVDFMDNTETLYSTKATCPKCDYTLTDIDPIFFSFNNSKGQCEKCYGTGISGYYSDDDTDSEELEDEIEDSTICPSCNGLRLNEKALNIFIEQKNIGDISSLESNEIIKWIEGLKLPKKEKEISLIILNQLRERLSFLSDIGLDYLSLNRSARTLSGGETQRIRLASQLGSSLIGIIYVLDEPSIGLHPKDHDLILNSLNRLKERGNTILMVEHDLSTILTADHVIDIGPGAGIQGGEIIATGTPKDISSNSNSLTGLYLSGKNKAYFSKKREINAKTKYLTLNKASGNNLQNITVKFPLEKLTTVTGVSGSGKSTLVMDTLYKALHNEFYYSPLTPSPYKSLDGLENLENVVHINQRPIGRTPRSNPATYVGLFSMIRDLFAQLPDSKLRGYKPGRFSFNVKGGRCENCQGAGQVKVEMHFMANVYVPCEICDTKRYNRETLEVKYKEKNIADVLAMSIKEALNFFSNHAKIKRKLETLEKVGLTYLTLGQSSTTLSGGEAQRIKLSKELSKKKGTKCFYILDEPTTGLHFEDTKKLIELLHELVDLGNTVVVIEHNTDIIKSSDYIIDLGPGGGRKGGNVVTEGTLETIVQCKNSYTSKYL